MQNLTFITGNLAKAEQLSRYIMTPIGHINLELHEIQSLDLQEIVEHKAREAFKHVNTPVLVEDTSLTFTVLGKLPGPLIKWFLQELKNIGLCKLLDNFQDRSAVATVLFGYCDGETVSRFEGQMTGTINNNPKGERGFGWDPIFIPEGCNKTIAEMTETEVSQISMRKIALQKLETYLALE